MRDSHCDYHGAVIALGHQARDNCNTCYCEESSTEPGCLSVDCTMQQCAVDLSVLQELERGAEEGLYSWHPANSSVMWGRTLLQVITNNLGTLKPQTEGLMAPVQFSYSGMLSIWS